MIHGLTRPEPFRPDAANPEVPGDLVFGYGSPARGKLVTPPNARGIAKVAFQDRCGRCGGAGGADKWALTGWTCFDCGGKGAGPIRTANAYTPEAFAKLTARREKLAAKRAAAAAAAEEARRAPYFAWSTANEHVLQEIARNAPADLVERIQNDAGRFVIPPSWLIDVAVAAAVREGLKADVRAASRHVGAVGDRVELTVTCERLLDYSERSGNYLVRAFYIALMRDADGNRVVYKGGTPPAGEGDTVRLKATVKEHGDRDGEAQTVIFRPKVIEALP